jgi:DNA-binding XRE family transcriptional regulator
MLQPDGLHSRVLRDQERSIHGIRNKGQAIPAQDLEIAGTRIAGLAGKVRKMKKTNFDLYLEEQLKQPGFAERFERPGQAWDVALQLSALRQKAGLSQKDLARKLKTSQQNISRLESPSYEGHSLAMLRRVDNVLGATVRVTFESPHAPGATILSEPASPYKTRTAS